MTEPKVIRQRPTRFSVASMAPAKRSSSKRAYGLGPSGLALWAGRVWFRAGPAEVAEL